MSIPVLKTEVQYNLDETVQTMQRNIVQQCTMYSCIVQLCVVYSWAVKLGKLQKFTLKFHSSLEDSSLIHSLLYNADTVAKDTEVFL